MSRVSRNLGEGDSWGVESESDRAFEGDFDGVRTENRESESASPPPSPPLAALLDLWLASWLPIIASIEGGRMGGSDDLVKGLAISIVKNCDQVGKACPSMITRAGI